MAEFPIFNNLFDFGIRGVDANPLFEQWSQATLQLPGAMPQKIYNIMNGNISVSNERCIVDTESSLPTDELTTISASGIHDGAIITLSSVDNGRIVKVVHSTNVNGIMLPNGADIFLSTEHTLELRRVGAYWSYIPTYSQQSTETKSGVSRLGTAEEHTAGTNGVAAQPGHVKAMIAAVAGALFPTGSIILWHGLVTAIPLGWAVCNGTNGTPDLCNRYIVGAGGDYAQGAKGGSAAGNGMTGNTTLTIAQMPNHSHGQQAAGSNYSSQGMKEGYAPGFLQPTTTMGGSGSHSHDIFYHALIFIMKL